MLSQRAVLRTRQLLARQTPVARVGRRNYSDAKKIELQGAQDNPFNRERAAVKQHAADTSGTWRKLSIYVVIPCLCIAAANAYKLWNEHWEHWAHSTPLEERTQYPYQNIRTKNFFFGDGDKTLFWNPNVNYHKTE